MTYITDRIADFVRAAEAKDEHAKRFTLDLLHARQLTLADWQAIRDLLQKHKLNDDLERITKSFITASAPTVVEPYLTIASLLIRSGYGHEGYNVILKYVHEVGDLPHNRIAIISTLFNAGHYKACLEILESALKVEPLNFTLRAYETRCLWRVGRLKDARRKHAASKALLGAEISNWTSFMAIAREIGEIRLARAIGEELVIFLESSGKVVSKGAIVQLTDAGLPSCSQRLIGNAKPEDYHDTSDLTFFFNSALEFGLLQVALRFGQRIMQVAPDERIGVRLKQIPAQLNALQMLNLSRRA